MSQETTKRADVLRSRRRAGNDPRAAGSTEGRPSARLGQHLRRLREGYGYTLRKVEEKAMSIGEAIDNSQLSRFEKGKALPSFDKLRALARIFNVSVQNFSDVLDLETFEPRRPDSSDYGEILTIGADQFAKGEFGRAFVSFEKALEVATEDPTGLAGRAERMVEARWRMAAALKALGKLTMCERELREILRLREGTGPRIQLRALMHLSFVYRELGDLYLARVLAREALDIALEQGDVGGQAAALNTLGNVHETDDLSLALGYYRRADDLLRAFEGAPELGLMVRTNLGGCLVKAHHFAEGMAILQQAYAASRERGYRRVAALSATRMAEAHLQRADRQRAAQAFAASDALSAGPDEPYNDILFLNAYHRWVSARVDGNDTREKIAFGRLRHLRSLLERRFPEVDAFDGWVGKNRRMDHEDRS
jgi:transcriptional regulator with XRE-family HTH domain